MADGSQVDERNAMRHIDSLRRERDSIERLQKQARMTELIEEIKRLNQEFDKLDADLSNEADSSD